MAFKNALKNLIAHFGVVWALLLYIAIFALIITGLGLPFLLPIMRAFGDAGVFDGIGAAFSSILGEGGWSGFWEGLYSVYRDTVELYTNNDAVASLTLTFFIIIVVIAFRFFLGLHEIPLATVLDGKMSCNAVYGLGGKFFSTLWVSARFSAAKMLVTTVYDAILAAAIFGLGKLIGMNVVLPFVLILVFAVLVGLRCGLTSCWAASVVNGSGIIAGFAESVKLFFKNFGHVFSTYFVTVLLVFAAGLFITVFTLGAGLIIVVPFVLSYFAYINITVYYNKTGRRYYIDGDVFTPPATEIKR